MTPYRRPDPPQPPPPLSLKERFLRWVITRWLDPSLHVCRMYKGGHWECYYPDTLFHGPGWQQVPACTKGNDPLRDALLTCEDYGIRYL